ncbi:MAG: chemotaxis protein CheW [Nitrospiraceae bacterium]
MAFRQRVTGPVGGSVTARFLVTQINDTSLALWADTVRGVLTPNEMGAAQEVTLLGDTYRATDMARRLGLLRLPTSVETRFVLCQRGQGRCVVSVDRVIGLMDIRRDRIQQMSPLFAGAERVWLRGVFVYDERMAVVINPDWLVHDLEATTPVLQPARAA